MKNQEDDMIILTTILLIMSLPAVGGVIMYGSKEPTTYEFKLDSEYVKADRQQFRIMFTGEVSDCYFYKDGYKYSTCDYRVVRKAR